MKNSASDLAAFSRNLLLLLGLVPVVGCVPVANAAEAPACRAGETGVVVLTTPHVLALCAEGKEQRRWKVALGSGGVDKKVQGDARTPLGSYPLGKPRPSSSFHTFIPVAYPTPAQAKAGFTGSAVGIHGPPRAFRGMGLATVETDWTLGCIALPSDEDVDAVGAFVTAKHAGLRVER